MLYVYFFTFLIMYQRTTMCCTGLQCDSLKSVIEVGTSVLIADGTKLEVELVPKTE